MAQLVKCLLPTPEIRGSIPDIGKVLSTNCIIEKTKIKKKAVRNGPSLKLKKITHEDFFQKIFLRSAQLTIFLPNRV